MDNLFAILLLLSLVGLFITLIKPSWGLFWLKAPSRKKGLVIYSLTNTLFFVCFGVSIHHPFKIAPYYINSDSLKHTFSQSTPAYMFKEFDQGFETVSGVSGFATDSMEKGDHIRILYNPEDRIIYRTILTIKLPDTNVTIASIDKLRAFARYFDKGAAEKYRELETTVFSEGYCGDHHTTIADKDIAFEISDQRWNSKIEIFVENLNPEHKSCMATDVFIEFLQEEHPRISRILKPTITPFVAWIVRIWSFTDYYPYGSLIRRPYRPSCF